MTLSNLSNVATTPTATSSSFTAPLSALPPTTACRNARTTHDSAQPRIRRSRASAAEQPLCTRPLCRLANFSTLSAPHCATSASNSRRAFACAPRLTTVVLFHATSLLSSRRRTTSQALRLQPQPQLGSPTLTRLPQWPPSTAAAVTVQAARVSTSTQQRRYGKISATSSCHRAAVASTTLATPPTAALPGSTTSSPTPQSGLRPIPTPNPHRRP